ncbi:MAG TPA: YciI family protein [Candidatus Limnocylindria bacterium]|nr:YciI family protein [Candidatus Limnocylindria bacterium]
MLLIYVNPESYAGFSEAEQNAIFGEYLDYTAKMRGAGAFVYGDPLQGVDTATVVRVRDGARAVTDGPFAESKEVLVGYYQVEAESLDEALEWAAQIPDARFGAIEVRPVAQLPPA